MDSRKSNLVSKSKQMMIPLQKATVESQSMIISSILGPAVDLDIFVSALALVQLSGELIVKMEEMGMAKEVEALKYDWVNIVTNPEYNEIVDIDKLPKNQRGKWNIEGRNRKK